MAIQGTINYKGIQALAYIKVSVIGISDNITQVDNPAYAPADPEHPTEEELSTKTISLKKHMLQFGYSLKANSTAEQFGNGSEQIECDVTENLFSQAYSFLATKFNISSTLV